MFRSALILAVLLAGAAAPSAAPPQTAAPAARTGAVVPAVNFGSRRGSTDLAFRGTDRMPAAAGTVKIEAQRGFTKVHARFTDLQNPTALGHEYLTYILWAVSPDGRAFNLGEVPLPGDRNVLTSLLPGNRSELKVTTPLQTFALIVTAEPYYAVRAPSDVVILENVIPGELGPVTTVDARLDLVERGYVATGFKFDLILLRTNLPLDFFQARNAVRIAEAIGAPTHAAAVFANARAQLDHAESLAARTRFDKRALASASREAVQTAEDAREMASRRVAALTLEEERRAAAAREAEARAQAQADQERRRKAEADRAAADAQRAAAEAQRAAAETMRAAAEAERLDAERRRAEADRASQDAARAAQEARRARADAEEMRQAALRQQQAAEAEAARNRAAAAELDQKLQQVTRDREELRGKLLHQLSAILETRDTARGLVVNLSDVTFATGQASLQPGAREKLARVSGILAAHASLTLEIEGHTDSVGSDEYNQDLSERRADAVRAYLVQQGVPAVALSAIGFGKSRPVADNGTAEGRQLNRRVELVVSGEEIGTQGR